MPESISKIHENSIIELGRALRTFSLYGEKHPSTKDCIQSLWKVFSDLFQNDDHFEIAVQENKILVYGKVMDEKTPVVKTLLNLFDKLGILSLNFRKELTEQELLSLIRVFAESPSIFKQTGDPQDILKAGFISNIEVNTAIYTKVGKSQLPSDLELPQGSKQPPQKIEMTNLAGIMTLFEGLSGARKDRFISKLLETPETLELLASEGVKPGVIDDTMRILESSCNSFLQKASKAASNPQKILKSFAAYKDFMMKKLEGGEAQGLREIFRKTYDDLRTSIIANQYLQVNRSQKSISDIVKKWIPDSEEMWRLIPQIRLILAEKGLGSVPLTEVLGTFGEKSVVDHKGLISKLQKILTSFVPDPSVKAGLGNSILDTVSQFVNSEVQKNSQELREANVRLIQEKRRMETIFENVSDGMVVTDPAGKIGFLNPAARALLGIGPNDPIDPNLLEKLMPGRAVALAKGGVQGGSWETQLLGDAATKKTLRESVGVIRDENGEVTGSIFVLSDVTRQREMIENKTKLFSQVVYDMRVSFSSLKESLALLSSQMQGEVPEDQKKLLEISLRGVQHLNEALSRLYEPVGRGKKSETLVKQWFNLESLIRQTTSGMDTWIASKKIKFDLSFPKQEILLALNLDHFLDLLHALIALQIRISQVGGKILIESEIPMDRPDVFEISFESLNRIPEAENLWSNMKESRSSEAFMSCVFVIIGIKLPNALEALQMEGFSCSVMDKRITLALPLPA